MLMALSSAARRRFIMGIVGWIVLGVALGMLAGSARAGALGAIGGGLIGVAAGLGSFESFFTTGTWVTAAGGALLLVALARAGTPEQVMAPELRERDVRQLP
jgi:hypothetical protein